MIYPAVNSANQVREQDLAEGVRPTSEEITIKKLEEKQAAPQANTTPDKYVSAIEVAEKISGAQLTKQTTEDAVNLVRSAKVDIGNPEPKEDLALKSSQPTPNPGNKDLISQLKEDLSVYNNAASVKPSEFTYAKIQDVKGHEEAIKTNTKGLSEVVNKITEQQHQPTQTTEQKWDSVKAKQTADELSINIQKNAAESMRAHSNITPQEVMAMLK